MCVVEGAASPAYLVGSALPDQMDFKLEKRMILRAKEGPGRESQKVGQRATAKLINGPYNKSLHGNAQAGNNCNRCLIEAGVACRIKVKSK